MGGRREVSIISHRPVTRNDLKQERSFFRGSVSTFLQLVVASGFGAPAIICRMKSYMLLVRQDDRTDQSLRTIIFVAGYLYSTVNVITINNKLTFSLLK